MRNSILITLILALASFSLLIAGCSGGIFSGGGTELPGQSIYRVGTRGLSFGFYENSPPEEAVVGKEFRVIVNAANIGANDIVGGKISLSTIQGDMDVANKDQALDLKGKSLEYPQGERKIFSWKLTPRGIIAPPFASEVSVVAEYNYQTDADIEICIDPDIYNEMPGRKACTMVNSISLPGEGQGAPIMVSEVYLTRIFDNSETSGEVEFLILLENVGGGSLGSLSSTGQEEITAEVVLSGNPITCDSNKISLIDGEGRLVCHTTYSDKAESEKLMHIKLNYVYSQMISPVEIMVKKA